MSSGGRQCCGDVLTDCTFRDCRFNLAQLSETAFLNCTFTGCSFFQTVFTDCKAVGSRSERCTFDLTALGLNVRPDSPE